MKVDIQLKSPERRGPGARSGRIVLTMVLAARFDSVIDVTLDELRIELVYPLDAEADAFFSSDFDQTV